ncbi:MAG: glycosyltransferase [Chloroflexi bacterium]|nr:glycosyltransferase [Chloroflexota bacterium]
MAMNHPLVSVIIPAYNAQNFIGETIQSVINQTYPDWEMLVVDDGSTDETRQVIEKYLTDSRVKYLYQPNQERAAARNHGLRGSSGKYIAFLDADDLWLPDKLKVQVEYLDTHSEMGLCFTHHRFINEEGTLTGKPGVMFKPGPDQFSRLLEANFIANSTVIIARTVFDKLGLFDESLPAYGSEDWDMWLRIARFYPIHFIDQPLTLYRLHEGNTSLERMRLSAEAVLKKIFTDPTLPASIVRKKAQVYGFIQLGFSETYMRLNQRKRAFQQWQRAIKAYPPLLVTPRGLWATLKLFLPYWLITNLPRLRLWGFMNAPTTS